MEEWSIGRLENWNVEDWNSSADYRLLTYGLSITNKESSIQKNWTKPSANALYLNISYFLFDVYYLTLPLGRSSWRCAR